MINIVEKITKYQVVYEEEIYFVTIYEKNNEESISIQNKEGKEINNNTHNLVENYFNLIMNE